MTIHKDMVISEILQLNRGFIPILQNAGMHCLGCPSSQMETLAEACMVHGIDADHLIEELNNFIAVKE